MNKFVHLHGHSEYSALDGFAQVKKIVERVKDIGQPAIAITDHGNLDGCYKFYKECKKQKIKPILGGEFYCTEEYTKVMPFHITLLAKNNTGWVNLLKLHRISHENFYYKPRISFEDLFGHKEGIICLSGCPSGPANKAVQRNDQEKASRILTLFRGEFADDFYIELMEHELDFQEGINKFLREYSKSNSIKRVITNDYHYVIKEHALYQEYLICDNLKITIHDNHKLRLESTEFYIKTREEMPGEEEEKDMTLEIADKCNVELKFNGFLLPVEENEEERLFEFIQEGIEKFKLQREEIYLDRLRTEYQVIKDAKLIGYFLTVRDYIQWARDNNILVGPGRGSVGGCLIGYLIGIHDIDPIKHKLLFSRFYNAGRSKSLPDVDTDFTRRGVERVRQYVRDKYGSQRVSHIGTHTYLEDKSALKLICRVLGVEFQEANYFSTVIEDVKQTAELRKTSASFRDISNKVVDFKGLAMYSSIHAAGMIISPIDLDTIVPLRINKDSGGYVSSWDMKDIEELGLVKFDFLSLNTLDVIQDTLNQINIKIEDIPHDDQDTFTTINTTNNVGIFQLSSDGISKLANNLKVKDIDDIAAVVALYRPGVLNSGLHIKYLDRRNGIEKIEYAHPLLEEVLNDTYGIFVYQEQIIKTVMVLAGFSETDADLLRKAIGKKIPKLMKEQQERFMNGCEVNKIDSELAESLWKEIQEFAEYSFNRAHSVGYAYITYYTAYLKTHYSCEFMAACLNNNYNHQRRLPIYLKDCEEMGIEVIPPSVTKGSLDFKASNGKIVFGLKGIKGIGEKTSKSIYADKYDSFEDFCLKFKPSSDTLIALAEAGVFDEFGYKRNQIIQSASYVSDMIKSKRKINPKQKTLFKIKPKLDIVNVPELPNDDLANREYNRLNTYLTHNPLKGVDLVTPEKLEGYIKIEGFLIGIKEHITKKKEAMGFLTIITQLGQIEALLFPRDYRSKKAIIKKNMFVGIEGMYDDKLLIRHIWEKI